MEKRVADFMRHYRQGRVSGPKKDLSKAIIDMKNKLGHNKSSDDTSKKDTK